MRHRDFARDRQPQPGGLGTLPRGDERLEDVVGLRGGNTRSVVGDAQQHVVIVLGHFDLDKAGTPRRQRLLGVLNQVERRLQQVQWLALHDLRRRRQVQLHRQVGTTDRVLPQLHRA